MSQPKPRNRLTVGPLSNSDDVVAARKAQWAGWIEQCDEVQDRVVEGLLGLIADSEDE